jgi:hypothetical protein
MAKTRLRHSIFGILLIAFLLVVLPIYLAGFLVYDWGIHQVKSEISRSIEAKNRSVIEAMDSSFRATRNHLSSLLNNGMCGCWPSPAGACRKSSGFS